MFLVVNNDTVYYTTLLEKEQWCYLTHSREDKRVHDFPKCLKVNVIAWLEFELDYHDSAIPRFKHYTTKPPPILECETSDYLSLCEEISWNLFKSKVTYKLFT